MVNLIWIFMLVSGLLFSIFNGTIDEVNKGLFDSAGQAVELVIGFAAIFTLWLGMMEIARRAGLLNLITKLCFPLIQRLFPDLPKNHPAAGYIMTNVSANFFGLGNAATPFGVKAMKELQVLNHQPEKASRSMVTFLCLNTAAVTFFPATIVSMRLSEGAADPLDIVIPAFAATICSCTAAIIYDRISWRITSGKNHD
ncbi:nucleoside recognition domain-containing protein [Jeotgalibacillus haloalkalitolerans]|uniref:Nucleoside recognition domain-containing protein n=1 Tax=Jeotgalibacillus haloalkalitolerans TaxID=3104292 RepID=A0ABU5KLE3_9BACL|nr:nucleoside recognition domain-containing protein [Jeotgalibacillus sp. HH7-29]MDZ5712053.1 nucleoside recognition domain-containing protein [Jeotgalibacillus sp. HH7-29]